MEHDFVGRSSGKFPGETELLVRVVLKGSRHRDFKTVLKRNPSYRTRNVPRIPRERHQVILSKGEKQDHNQFITFFPRQKRST